MIQRTARIAAGTTNPAKLVAIERAARDVLGNIVLEEVDVDSRVPDQPWGDEETALGAFNRASSALSESAADFGIGVESGLAHGPDRRVFVVSWAAAVDSAGNVGYGASERFPVPQSLEAALTDGAELGPLIDEILGRPGLARRKGVVSVITQGRRDRTEILSIAVLHAVIALLEPWQPS